VGFSAVRLVLYSLPFFDMRTGELCSEDLLVRIIDAEGCHVAAGQFFPTGVRFGLIGWVDHWVIERAVDVIAGGRPASVNISAASIADTDLTELVARCFEKAGVTDPAMLTFEITETVATPSIEVLRDFANRVDALGCGLSLDDVGTGFGSLTYLQNLRFTELKIDMQFIRGILKSDTDAGIVRSLVVIADQLGLKTVGEGVENERILAKLEELGVDRAQGYYFGPPRPVGPVTPR
jgi:EAL domain-containing protein (putative c-di-GMP-specific phosphodiesterase class I)